MSVPALWRCSSVAAALVQFCKACLERHIVTTRERDVVRCPVRSCHTTLIATHPMRTEIRYDRAMQNLVDKLLPQFAKADEDLKRKLEQQYGGAKRPAPAPAAASSEPAAKKHKFGDDKLSVGRTARRRVWNADMASR